MKKFKVSVVRIGYAFKEIEVESKTQAEAKRLAIEQAGGLEFSEKDADYKVTYIHRVVEP